MQPSSAEKFKSKNISQEKPQFSEVHAINLTLDLITKSRNTKHIIFSDSQSAIVAIKGKKFKNPLIAELLTKLNNLCNHKKIVLCWIPSHIGIQGNEMADSAAKTAQNHPLDTLFKIPFTDLKRTLNIYTKQKWQNYWDNFQNNKLHKIMTQIGKSQKNQTKISRKEEIILSRLRTGHSHITHSYLLKKEEAPYCIPCQKPYTIKHILTECIDLKLIQKKYYLTTNLKQIFYEINPKNLLRYLKEVHLYSKNTTPPPKKKCLKNTYNKCSNKIYGKKCV